MNAGDAPMMIESKEGAAMKEKLSLMLDGELDGAMAAGVLDRLGDDAGLRGDWRTWCLIGDALRGEEVAVSPDFSAKVMSALNAEPTVLVPGAIRATLPLSSPSSPSLSSAPSSSSWSRHLLAVAASVMGVLAVGGVVATLSPGERTQAPAPVLAQTQTQQTQSSAPLSAPRPGSISVVSMAEDAVRHEYLAAHEHGIGDGRWRLQTVPPGFALVSRSPGHMVFSDGRAAMLLFIQHPDRPSAMMPGGVNVVERVIHGQRFTVFGDAPAPAMRQLAEAIEVAK
jgi:sigma-E factor negative regulatory protein RseA